ncbi:MAG TPA: HEPN domain-containing protein [Firmicutes bacterium]|nr:HEPN domain-containing protein [Bacillota bacterium]
MVRSSLAQSYLVKARSRLKILPVLLADEDYSDVLREAQEIVELALKGMLRQVGIEPPKFHDVGPALLEFADRFAADVRPHLEEMAAISRKLRREREFAFYGDIDFIPTEAYSREEAETAIAEARQVVALAAKVIPLD